LPLLIDDAEAAVHLAVRAQAPNLVQLESWARRFSDIDTYLKAKSYGHEAIAYFQDCVRYLLRSDSKQDMHDRFRKEFEPIWPRDFVFYYRKRLLPRSGRLGKWAMAKMHIADPKLLSIHHSPESAFLDQCGDFVGWDALSLGQTVRAFYYLFLYFVSEMTQAKADMGQYVIRCVAHVNRNMFSQIRMNEFNILNDRSFQTRVPRCASGRPSVGARGLGRLPAPGQHRQLRAQALSYRRRRHHQDADQAVALQPRPRVRERAYIT
jgi:hypothetical protein